MSATSPEVVKARRAFANLRAVVRREHTTGWVDRSAAPQYRAAFRAVLAVEDVHGVDVAGPLDDRLTALRQEAMRAGLMDASDMLTIDREECDRAPHA